MSRMMVVGYELPDLAEGAIEARSYRTWQFVEPLLDDGHEVCLIVSHEIDAAAVSHALSPCLTYHRLDMRRLGWPKRLRQLHNRFDPDGLLAVMFNNCLRVTRLSTDRPIWMDVYGDRLAEAQVAEYTQGSSRGRRNTFRYLRMILSQGDVYSTCGTPQKHALVGQLAMAARLNRHTLGYEFVHPILPGAPRRLAAEGEGLSLRDDLVRADGFVVLWCGGYNVWTDVDVLFQALDAAMSAEPRVEFVSVGGKSGHAENDAYDRLLGMIDGSAHRQRYHMLGWRPVSEVPIYYRGADVGISLDAFHYETLLGTRTRLVEMMGYGLPVITTLGCELSDIIRDQELGLTFSIGDADGLCEQILRLAGSPARTQALAERAQRYAAEELSFAETTRQFREWAVQPYHAPDLDPNRRRWDPREVEYYLRSVIRGWLWHFGALERGE